MLEFINFHHIYCLKVMAEKPNNIFSLLKRLILIVLGIVFSLLLVLSILFRIYKDDIAKTILLRVNNVQPGELTFDDIAFNPFTQFPSISIELNEVDYFERKNKERVSDNNPIVSLEKIFLAFDIINLVKGNLDVSKVLLENGKINLKTYADSTFNLLNAIRGKQHADTKMDTTSFELDVEKIELSRILVYYQNIADSTQSSLSIQSLDASLSYLNEIIKLQVNTHIQFNEVDQAVGFLIQNKQLKFESSLVYEKKKKTFLINSGKLLFEKANFKINGILNVNQPAYIDVSIEGDDEDFSILSLFLSETGMDNVKKGNLNFNGIVKGSIFPEIPTIDFLFRINDVEILIPNTDESIRKLCFSGNFKSGEKKDFSEANLVIKDLKADLPGGGISGFLSIHNFSEPHVNIKYKMKADVYGFDKILNIGLTDSLTGNVDIEADFSGVFNLETSSFIEDEGETNIVLKDVSFVIPKVNPVKNLNGSITFIKDTTHLNDLKLDIGSSDFIINGSITHIFDLLLKNENPIVGNLHVLSETFDFPNFFQYDSSIANSFAYRINDIDLSVVASTSSNDLSVFNVVPRIKFDIQKLTAEIEDFLPPLNINAGVFTLGELDSTLNLVFSGFDIEIADSQILAEMVLNSPKDEPIKINIDANTTNFNPQKALVYWFNDSLHNALNGNFTGLLHLDLDFSSDTIIDFDKLDFTAENLSFINTVDTISIQKLNLDTKNIIYNTSHFLNSLSFEMELISNNIQSNEFTTDLLDFSIQAKSGIYQITTNKDQYFKGRGEGTILLKPFEDIPRYEIKYKAHQFDVGDFFSAFREDTVISGKMDLDFEMVIMGNSKEEFRKTLNGRLLLYGKDLTFYGMDLDKVIDRFKRSQNFTLADVGALALMGPAGILVTKGSDLVSIVVLNPGEASEVMELSSDWEFNNGLVNLADVAFSTRKNRMAVEGWVDLNKDSLNVTIALLNKKGCSLNGFAISGSPDNLKTGKVKIVKSILAPVTNLLTSEDKCDVFYSGKVKHPEKE